MLGLVNKHCEAIDCTFVMTNRSDQLAAYVWSISRLDETLSSSLVWLLEFSY